VNHNLRFLLVILCLLYKCILVAQPTAFSVIQPSCTTPAGTIVINYYEGMYYSLDGIHWKANNTFTEVTPGSYYLYIWNGENSLSIEKSSDPIIIYPIRCTRLTLYITDINSHPIDGATVSIGGQLYSTNSEGKLTLVLPEGVYPFHISAWDFADKSGTLTLTGTSMLEQVILDHQPVLRYWVTLYFINENGQPIKGATIYIQNNLFITNTHGYIVLHLTNGNYDFLAEEEDYHDYNGTFLIDGRDRSYTFIMTAATVHLNIEKTVSNNTPLPGSEVTFTITIQNLGTMPAMGVTVTDDLSPGYLYLSSHISRGIDLIQHGGLWIVGDMESGSSDTLTIHAEVKIDGDYYHNTAFVNAFPSSSFASSTVMVFPIGYPHAHDDYVSIPRKGSALINVTANDTDFNHQKLNGVTIRITKELPSGAFAETRPDGYIFIDYSMVPAFIGDEYLEYEVTSIHGFKARANLMVNVNLSDIFIPDTFSPNGDGINDYFVIPGVNQLPGNELVVFNRWGNIVFQMKNYDNSWDGRFASTHEHLPSGTYFYTFNPGNQNTLMKGFIYIIR
jgi:gliding motility-associated-like protein/uncharacterized repeat protein (TIGR01451 family)